MQPVEEPPPHDSTDTLIDVVCENLKQHMNDGTKADFKPKIASLVLDNPTISIHE